MQTSKKIGLAMCGVLTAATIGVGIGVHISHKMSTESSRSAHEIRVAEQVGQFKACPDKSHLERGCFTEEERKAKIDDAESAESIDNCERAGKIYAKLGDKDKASEMIGLCNELGRTASADVIREELSVMAEALERYRLEGSAERSTADAGTSDADATILVPRVPRRTVSEGDAGADVADADVAETAEAEVRETADAARHEVVEEPDAEPEISDAEPEMADAELVDSAPDAPELDAPEEAAEEITEDAGRTRDRGARRDASRRDRGAAMDAAEEAADRGQRDAGSTGTARDATPEPRETGGAETSPADAGRREGGRRIIGI